MFTTNWSNEVGEKKWDNQLTKAKAAAVLLTVLSWFFSGQNINIFFNKSINGVQNVFVFNLAN